MPDEVVDVPEENVEPEPQYVTRDDYDRLAGLVATIQQSVNAGFDALAAQRQTRHEPEPTIEDVTDEELEEALNQGTGAQKFRKMVNAAAARLAKDQIEPLRAEGQQAIAGLVKQTATQNLPHYKKYQKEIDEYVDRLPANQRLNPEVYEIAHNIVVGKHVTEIVNESVESFKRGSGGGAPHVNTPGGQGRSTVGFQPSGTITKPPSTEQAGLLADRGDSPDQFAMKLGYKSWDEYMTKAEEYQ